MSLSEKHRSSIYLTLAPLLGEEEAEALLSQFPARELDEPVTKEFVRAEIAGVRTEMAEMRQRSRAASRSCEPSCTTGFGSTMWMAGALVAGMGVASGIASLIR